MPTLGRSRQRLASRSYSGRNSLRRNPVSAGRVEKGQTLPRDTRVEGTAWGRRLTLLSIHLPEVMVGMGYTREEIKEALTNQKYNEVTATYLLLGRKTEVRGHGASGLGWRDLGPAAWTEG